jgi:cytochrome bd-type quinol oxidase subunit 1
MVGETTMNRRNGSTPSPPNGVAKGMGELTHDIVSLAELQFELFRVDCREGLRRILIPVALLLFSGIVAVGTVPIALILVAEFLVQTADLSRAEAFLIAAMSGVIVALTIGVVGWSYLRGVVRVFERSREELTRNMTWIKHALKRSAPIESQQPQDR